MVLHAQYQENCYPVTISCLSVQERCCFNFKPFDEGPGNMGAHGVFGSRVSYH